MVVYIMVICNGDLIISTQHLASSKSSVDACLIPGLGRSTGEAIGHPLQYFGVFFLAQLVRSLPAMWKTWVQSLGWEYPWRREWLPTPVFWPGKFHGMVFQKVGHH